MIVLQQFSGTLKDTTPVRRNSVRTFKTPAKSTGIVRGAVVPSGGGLVPPSNWELVPFNSDPFIYENAPWATLTKESEDVWVVEVTRKPSTSLLGVVWRNMDQQFSGTLDAVAMFQFEVIGQPAPDLVGARAWNGKPNDQANRVSSNCMIRNPPNRYNIEGDIDFYSIYPRMGFEYFWINGSAQLGTKARIWKPAVFIVR